MYAHHSLLTFFHADDAGIDAGKMNTAATTAADNVVNTSNTALDAQSYGCTPSTATPTVGDEFTLEDLQLQPLTRVTLLPLSITILLFVIMVTLKVPHHLDLFFDYLTIQGSSFINLLLSYISSPMQHLFLHPTTSLTF